VFDDPAQRASQLQLLADLQTDDVQRLKRFVSAGQPVGLPGVPGHDCFSS
jgi:hypothetical protein